MRIRCVRIRYVSERCVCDRYVWERSSNCGYKRYTVGASSTVAEVGPCMPVVASSNPAQTKVASAVVRS